MIVGFSCESRSSPYLYSKLLRKHAPYNWAKRNLYGVGSCHQSAFFVLNKKRSPLGGAWRLLVGEKGFEPLTSAWCARRSNHWTLSYSPTEWPMKSAVVWGGIYAVRSRDISVISRRCPVKGLVSTPRQGFPGPTTRATGRIFPSGYALLGVATPWRFRFAPDNFYSNKTIKLCQGFFILVRKDII